MCLRMVSDSARFYVVAASGIALALFMIGMTWLGLRSFEGGEVAVQPSGKREKTYRRTLVENLHVTRHGIRGVDFVSCRVCRMEKRKKGFLTLGGMNVLVLEDLSVVLPEVEEKDGSSEMGDDDARSIVQRMGVSDGFLKERGIPMKFSGLKVSNLTVSRLSKENRPEMVFSARTAEAARGGLRLSGCKVYEAGTGDGVSPVPVSGAMLSHVGRKLRLTWNGGQIDLN